MEKWDRPGSLWPLSPVKTYPGSQGCAKAILKLQNKLKSKTMQEFMCQMSRNAVSPPQKCSIFLLCYYQSGSPLTYYIRLIVRRRSLQNSARSLSPSGVSIVCKMLTFSCLHKTRALPSRGTAERNEKDLKRQRLRNKQ